MTKKSRNLTNAAMQATLYVVLALLQELLLPGTASLVIQFRFADALCVLAVFTPAAIPGLTLGCLLFNLLSSAALPMDFLIGSVATLLSTALAYALRRIRVGKLPLLSLLMPVVLNAVFVGCELWYYVGGLPVWMHMLYVAAGEAVVMLTLGTAIYYAFCSKRLEGIFGG